MNNLYDIFKMQMDEAEALVKQSEKQLDELKKQNDTSLDSLTDSETVLDESIALLKSLGIDLSYELQVAEQEADDEVEAMLDEIVSANSVYERKPVSYEDLVNLAHSRGYENTTVHDLLTQEEIRMADERLASIENEFCSKTKLTKKDMAFLFTAVALQVVRQYLITPFSDRGTAAEAEEDMKKKYGKSGKMSGKYYYATEDAILHQKSVPYDIVAGSKKYGIGKGGKGLDGNSHRFRSLGHDPILGYVFGTANILTNTATWWNGTSHHIMYKPNASGAKVPVIAANADTAKIFNAVKERFETTNGKMMIVAALVKEHMHLKSDVSTDGLPLPFLQTISPDFAQELAEHGIDAISVGDVAKQAAGAELINFIISTIHSIICAQNGEMNRKLYQVRTRKIILLSNVIASTSNVIAVGIGAAVGTVSENPELVKKTMKYLDVGGILVTIAHLFSDLRFIAKIEEEFVNGKLDAALMIEMEKLDKYLVD